MVKENVGVGSLLIRMFMLGAITILAITGAAKVWSAFAGAKILASSDPLTGISFGRLILTVGFVELSIAAFCLFGKSNGVKLFIIAWLATNFVVYRIGIWAVGWHKPCSCLGNLTDALHISPHTADNIMKSVLAYLLIGSYGSLFWLWRQKRKTLFLNSQSSQPLTNP